MIDIANYKRSIEWLKRGMEAQAQAQEPLSSLMRDGLAHSCEVTYNISESILRQALAELTQDEVIPLLSSRELMRYAAAEGLALTSSTTWLRYGLALEQNHEVLGAAFSETLEPILSEYACQLEAFAKRLEGRLGRAA